MIFLIKLCAQIFRHDAQEIIVNDAFSDMAATPLVTQHKSKRRNTLRDIFTIIDTGIRTRSKNTRYARIFSEKRMTSRQSVWIYLRFRLWTQFAEYQFYLQLIAVTAASRAVKINTANILIINRIYRFTDNIVHRQIISEIRIKTIGNESFGNIIAIQKRPLGFR